VILKNYH
jgi:glycogen debranching enzyme